MTDDLHFREMGRGPEALVALRALLLRLNDTQAEIEAAGEQADYAGGDV